MSNVTSVEWAIDRAKIARFNQCAIDDPIGFAEFLLNNLQWLNEQLDKPLKSELKLRMDGHL